MTRVVAFNRFYPPQLAPTGIHLSGFCDALAHAGYQVEVCSSNTKYGTAPGLLKKILIQFGYAWKAFRFAMKQPRGTVVLSAADPPYLNILIGIVAKIKRHRHVMWLPDRYPGLALVFGFIKRNGFLHRLWRWLDLWARRNAAVVVAIGPVMQQRIIAEGTPRNKVRMIHNWIDAELVFPVDAGSNSIRSPHDDKTVFLYAGNAGRAHTMELLTKAIRDHQGDGSTEFWFAGNGYQLNTLRDVARQESWKNVRFIDYVPQEKLADLLSAGDVGVVTENPEVVGYLVPSKFYNILAAGRPVLYIGPYNSDVAQLIREHECGIIVSPDSSVELDEAIERLQDAHVRAEMGARGREAAVNLYDRRVILPQWPSMIGSILGEARLTAEDV